MTFSIANIVSGSKPKPSTPDNEDGMVNIDLNDHPLSKSHHPPHLVQTYSTDSDDGADKELESGLQNTHDVSLKSVSFEESPAKISPIVEKRKSSNDDKIPRPVSPTYSDVGSPWKYFSTTPSQSMTPSVMTSPTVRSDRSSDGPGSPSHATIVVEQKNKKGGALAKVPKKPMFYAIGSIILLLSGTTSYFFTKFLSIPGLRTQIDELAAQVDELGFQVDRLEKEVDELSAEIDRLGGEVDRLTTENDRYAALNTELAGHNENFSNQNVLLASHNALYNKSNEELRELNMQLSVRNLELREEVGEYQALNQNLNDTVSRFESQVQVLENITLDLNYTNNELAKRNTELANETEKLSLLNSGLNDTLVIIEKDVVLLSAENDRLEELNTNLGLIVSFLNETTTGIQRSYEGMTGFIADQIVFYRNLATENTQTKFTLIFSDWDCDFRDRFGTEPFGMNTRLPIGPTMYPTVIAYVQERVFSEICGDIGDFEVFLERKITRDGLLPPVSISMRKIISGVQQYSTLLMKHYFPNGPRLGLSSNEWAEADFDCEKLPSDRLFRYDRL